MSYSDVAYIYIYITIYITILKPFLCNLQHEKHKHDHKTRFTACLFRNQFLTKQNQSY